MSTNTAIFLTAVSYLLIVFGGLIFIGQSRNSCIASAATPEIAEMCR